MRAVGGPRGVTSGSGASAVPGRSPACRPAVRAGDAAWRSREARRRGSAGCPESGRTENFDLQAVLNLADKPGDSHLRRNAASLDV